jgi:hypothetical protein
VRRFDARRARLFNYASVFRDPVFPWSVFRCSHVPVCSPWSVVPWSVFPAASLVFPGPCFRVPRVPCSRGPCSRGNSNSASGDRSSGTLDESVNFATGESVHSMNRRTRRIGALDALDESAISTSRWTLHSMSTTFPRRQRSLTCHLDGISRVASMDVGFPAYAPQRRE